MSGMGNRFRDMPGYHRMICAHGVIGTIVFLGLVPLSVFLIRYYSRWNPFWAFKLHVWCQVLTLFLSTVVFVIGWFAVGPKRSLSNPHHGIGLAIYVLVIFQILWGWLVHKVERSRKRYHVPLKLVVSQMLFAFAIYSVSLLICGIPAPSMDWSYTGSSRYHSNSTGAHFIRLAKSAIHLVRNRHLLDFRGLLCVIIPIRYRRLPRGKRVR